MLRTNGGCQAWCSQIHPALSRQRWSSSGGRLGHSFPPEHRAKHGSRHVTRPGRLDERVRKRLQAPATKALCGLPCEWRSESRFWLLDRGPRVGTVALESVALGTHRLRPSSRGPSRLAGRAILGQRSGVRSYTPVATPVVRGRPQRKERPGVGKRPELVAPVTVLTPIGRFELGTGSLLLGRLPECDVMLEDSLASRMHARVSVQDTRVVIEDLHSTNGVYVNERRVVRGTVLRHGDRILIGTTEISLLESRQSLGQDLRISEPQPQSVARARPPSRVEIPSTARADALEMIGGVAERLAAVGNLEEAELVLSGHLRGILTGANSGLPVPSDLTTSASRYALELARWNRQQFWVDYVVELHLSARLVMSALTLSDFEDVSAKLDCDRVMLGYYVDDLQGWGDKLSPDEKGRVERLRLLQRHSRA